MTVLPLPGLGRGQPLPLDVLPFGDHSARISWEDVAEQKHPFPGENNPLWGCVSGLVTFLGPHASPQDPCTDGVSIPWAPTLAALWGWIQLRVKGLCWSWGNKPFSGQGVLTLPDWLPWSRPPPSHQSPLLGVEQKHFHCC